MPTVAVAHGFSVAGIYVGAGGGLACNNHCDSRPPGFRLQASIAAMLPGRSLRVMRSTAILRSRPVISIWAGQPATPIGTSRWATGVVIAVGCWARRSRVGRVLSSRAVGAARFRTQTTAPVSTDTVTTGFHPDYAAGVQAYLAHHIALRGEGRDFQIPDNRTQLYGGSLLFHF